MKSRFECRMYLAAIGFALTLSVDVEARILKSTRRGNLENRGQWETINGVPSRMPSSLRASRAKDGDATMLGLTMTGSDQPGYETKDEHESPDDVEREAAAEEDEDDKELKQEMNETETEGPEKEEESAKSEESRRQVEATLSEDITTTPPSEPYSHMYEHADAVARDAELRWGMEFHPQGSKPDIDISKQEQFKVDTFFSQDPSIFGHCLLIRDFAEPLRVGSALVKVRTQLRGHHRHPKALTHGAAKKWHANTSRASLYRPPHHFTHFAGGAVNLNRDDPSSAGAQPGDEKKLPDDVFLLKGGVTDLDMQEETKDGKSEDDVELEVSMFAFLRTVAGEVAVIPNGDVAKWSSMKKVPIAGYLCTSDQGPVLHTLPTPCLPTSIDENGQPFSPPRPPPPVPPTAPPAAKAPAAAKAPKATVPAPAAPVAPVKFAVDDSALEAEAEAEAAAAEAVANGPSSLLQMEVPKRSPAPAAAASPAGASGPAAAAAPVQPSYGPYHVWIGSTLLEFRSKPKAERFCKRLTKRIAEDMGDEEWDADKLLSEDINKKDMTVSNFMALTRKSSPDWTKGTKNVLVVVMDWMIGDTSRTPNSRQTQSPVHYKDKIFPRVRDAFRKMSYGQFDIKVTVVPEVVQFSKPRSRYTAGGYPFPGLYNGAKESLEGNWKFGDQYKFGSYDLVYVISPQQSPTGTKGVAWVGAKGALCNGCEEISENFQVMVAVHELGHNLGLWHASSKSLEYGNVFDWMGNYPDVTGLSYGLGYKLKLGWLPEASIAKITDANLASLNNEYKITAFDSSAPAKQGQVMGIRINLQNNRRDLYVAYRKAPGAERAGIFLTMQDRDKPNSELIDCACHSPSQQDAALRQGWTYIDPSEQVVIHAYKIEANVAVVRIFKAPGASGVAGIRARKDFTDGQWKCPRVCTDSDLLVSQYKGCAGLARDGYCSGGKITMGGKKFSIGTDLCPKSCDQCDAANTGGSLSEAGCADKNVKISGMSCGQVAVKGYCEYNTNIGHIGDDLCPATCGRCPAKPAAASSSSGGFTDPAPSRTFGAETAQEAPPIESETNEARNEEAAADEAAEESAADKTEQDEEAKAENPGTCTDDAVWSDADGDGCKVYADFVKQGKLSLDEACNYGTGESKVYCRKTCNTCQAQALSETCEDKQCVTRWRYERGKCFACDEWKGFCNNDFFANDCPRTCGMCHAEHPDTTPPLPTTPMPPTTTVAATMPPTEAPTPPPACEDESCVKSWLKDFGVCHKCADFAEDYCGRDERFMQSCPKSCKICHDGKVDCHDDFLPHTCKRYTEWGWCTTPHINKHCKASCGVCSAVSLAASEKQDPTESPTLFPGASSRQTSSSFLVCLSAVLLFLKQL